jgi:class 3 adenylate cyclase/pimeloyl-ACP methyl ester carboxylesterase
MGRPEFGYARTSDDVYIAYQVVGDGPVDLVWQSDWPGNIEVEWDWPWGHRLLSALASFSRVIMHDRRGIGLSSRNVPLPNLETRVSDTLAVLDEVGSEQPVLAGVFESGAPNVLLAATRSERVLSLVWIEPVARFAWAPDYPWGGRPDDLESELRDLEFWGTEAYGRAFVDDQGAHGSPVPMPESDASWMAKASRNACTPDVARELARIWYETDVRGVLPTVNVPTLFLGNPSAKGIDQTKHIASLVPGAELQLVEAPSGTGAEVAVAADHIRRFVGARLPPIELDTFLSTVLFTDMVQSTVQQASVGDHLWKEFVLRHHEIVRDALVRWQGVENDTAGDGFYATFDGPARAIRCALEVLHRVRDLGIQVRAGVHTGECELIDGKVGGLAVAIGARVAALAGSSEILASQTVKDLTAGSGITFEDAGEHDLKDVPGPWHLYRVVA